MASLTTICIIQSGQRLLMCMRIFQVCIFHLSVLEQDQYFDHIWRSAPLSSKKGIKLHHVVIQFGCICHLSLFAEERDFCCTQCFPFQRPKLLTKGDHVAADCSDPCFPEFSWVPSCKMASATSLGLDLSGKKECGIQLQCQQLMHICMELPMLSPDGPSTASSPQGGCRAGGLGFAWPPGPDPTLR